MVRSRRAWILGGAAVAPVLITVACSGGSTASDSSTTEDDAVVSTAALDGLGVDVRRDPGCGCCTSWVEYLQTHGADVSVREDANRQTFQEQSGVPSDGESCHTAVVDGYVVEGHVPAEAIARLLEDRPVGKGLALGGMPSDSPGMGGNESTWSEQAVMFISADGALSPFEY